MNSPFRFLTATVLESPAGIVATDIASLREGIASAPAPSLFHHVTRVPARFPHARDLPANDFARWVRDALQLDELGERIAVRGSNPLEPIDQLCAGLIETLDRAPSRGRERIASDGEAFHFVTVRIVLAPLSTEAEAPDEVVNAWPGIDLGAAWHHLVASSVLGRPEEEALMPWLRGRGAAAMADAAGRLVRAGLPLARLHREIGTRWRRARIGRRLADRAGIPEAQRKEEARAAVARLAGRLRTRRSSDEDDSP